MGKIAAASALLFSLLGIALIPYAGIQTDEPFFAVPIYEPPVKDYCIPVFHHQIPLMIFPYTGTLKTLLYWPILRIFGPNPYSLRIPVVLIGAVTVLLFFPVAKRMAGAPAALIASLLLATDPSFLLTNTFDWGPVAIEHLLLVTGCLLIALKRPALGFFCFGLALWNKAVFVWALAGLAAGAALVYWPELRRYLRGTGLRACVVCPLALLAGALPLIVYNFHAPNATMRSNVHISTEDFRVKLVSFQQTVEGSALFGFVTAPESEPLPKSPHTVSVWIRDHLGPHHSSLFGFSLLLSLLAAPLWWHTPGRRAALFAIAFSLVAFLAMAFTRYTGYAHHIVLLWPMPQLLVGVAVAALRPRWLAAAAATLLIAANLLVVNQYFAQLERNGAYGFFTDALYPLSDAIADRSGDTIYLVDWGVWGNLNFLHQGRLHLQPAWPIPARSQAEIEKMLSDPHALFLDHVQAREYYPGSGARLDAIAQSSGYQKQIVRTIQDSNGRPIFELIRWARIPPAA
jgi:4-amino-4-deoxy-L-arabinose transferase-like glycosyltransferase